MTEVADDDDRTLRTLLFANLGIAALARSHPTHVDLLEIVFVCISIPTAAAVRLPITFLGSTKNIFLIQNLFL